MNRRLHERTSVAFQVRVTSITNPDLAVTGEAVDISKSGIGLNLPMQFAPGTLLRLEIADSALCGYVVQARKWPQTPDTSYARNKVWVQPEGESNARYGDTIVYRTGIEIVEAAIGTSGLSELLKMTLEETMPYLEMAHAGHS